LPFTKLGPGSELNTAWRKAAEARIEKSARAISLSS
jgi:hypothetical protein